MGELLDIVDDAGRPTGQTVERRIAHREGIPHRTAHVWLARRHHGRWQLLVQKRSLSKDSHPGCYDISSAGHIPAGVDYIPSALRELKEELGVTAAPEDLLLCGDRKFIYEGSFHGEPFRDNQYSRVFLLLCRGEGPDFTLQKEELSSVRWIDLDLLTEEVKSGTIPNCIYPEELELVRQHLPAAGSDAPSA